MRKDMARISLFVYALIIFFSLFFVLTNGELEIRCVSDADCPLFPLPLHNRCIDDVCHLFTS
ncbi:putative Late nodulin [Medicago truncatula]|uniref:Nodule-specific cysteine-rich peptide 74 n=2 Tax=Medicago truncatula TaxID=3880 RepID=A7KH79_MEDTR|nr:nodule-specific cysteine-rich peptide 74 [Medicago truncatula]RHN60812.1 putative Late nodulin [Medicago truncatula]